MDSLEYILKECLEFQESLGYNLENMTKKDLANYIRGQLYFATEELHECGREIPYIKPWSKKYDKENYDFDKQYDLAKDEFIDVLHFVMNVAGALGMTKDEILERYKKKHQINYDRQKNNY